MTALQQAEALLAQLTDKETDILLHHIFDRRKKSKRSISKTPGICGGRACIEGTRMPVWSVINHQRLGFSDEEILYNFPSLTDHDLENARAYYDANKAEIDNDIWDNYSDEENE